MGSWSRTVELKGKIEVWNDGDYYTHYDLEGKNNYPCFPICNVLKELNKEYPGKEVKVTFVIEGEDKK